MRTAAVVARLSEMHVLQLAHAASFLSSEGSPRLASAVASAIGLGDGLVWKCKEMIYQP